MSDKKEDKKKTGDAKGDKKGGDKKDKADKKGGDKKDGGDKKGADKKGDKGADKKKDEKKPKDEPKKEEPKAAPAPEPAAAAAAEDGAGAPDEKAAAPVVAEPLDPQTALKAVLRTSLFHDGLARGLHESVKALDRREAHLCVLSSGCNEPAYTKLITALCSEHSIPLIKVEEGKVLGEWVGLCKFNSEGRPVKVVGCSCAVIKSWGEDTEARQFILDHIKQQS